MTITMACASCRFPNAPEAKFCRQCGAPLAANAAPPQAGIACPGCGQPVADGLKFCRTCGHQIAVPGQTAQSAAAPAAQAAAATPAPVHTPPPSRPRPVYASSRPQAPARRRKVWPWAVGGGLLAAVGIAGGLVYTGKLTLPSAAQRMVQDYVPVYAPEPRVGDTSIYEASAELVTSTNYTNYKAAMNEPITIHVTAIEDERINFNVSGRIGGEQLVYDKKLNAILFNGDDAIEMVTKFGVDSIFPYVYAHDFPLRPGKKWNKTGTRTLIERTKDGRELTSTENLTVTGTALGWERNIGRLDGVMVDGLKLRIQARADLIESPRSSVQITRTTTEWYVPAAKRSVLIRNQSDFVIESGTSRSVATMRLVNFIPTNSSETE